MMEYKYIRSQILFKVKKHPKMQTNIIYLLIITTIFTSYTMGFYEMPVDIRAILWYFFFNTEKNTKILQYFLKTHGINVLSYNYLIFSHHNAFLSL